MEHNTILNNYYESVQSILESYLEKFEEQYPHGRRRLGSGKEFMSAHYEHYKEEISLKAQQAISEGGEEDETLYREINKHHQHILAELFREILNITINSQNAVLA